LQTSAWQNYMPPNRFLASEKFPDFVKQEAFGKKGKNTYPTAFSLPAARFHHLSNKNEIPKLRFVTHWKIVSKKSSRHTLLYENGTIPSTLERHRLWRSKFSMR
jgi:hypothetical protein